jgi:hypothetical protein
MLWRSENPLSPPRNRTPIPRLPSPKHYTTLRRLFCTRQKVGRRDSKSVFLLHSIAGNWNRSKFRERNERALRESRFLCLHFRNYWWISITCTMLDRLGLTAWTKLVLSYLLKLRLPFPQCPARWAQPFWTHPALPTTAFYIASVLLYKICYEHHFHTPESDMSYSMSVPPGFPEPS